MNTRGMKQVGKGAFSTVYRHTHNTVLIKSVDNVKECMSLGWFPDTPMFPSIERIGQSDDGITQFYTERYYDKVKSVRSNLTQFEYQFYSELRKISVPYTTNEDGFTFLHKAFSDLPNKFWRKKELLKEALDGLANYGNDIRFEISPRNIAIHGKKLVLLDCFFFISQLEEIRK